MSGLVIDGFAGPGGWSEGLRMLGLRDVGIELDAAACATRRAAGHATIRADVSQFPVERLAGKTWGQVHSPPCVFFSGAGTRAGVAIMGSLADLTRDMFAGRPRRAHWRRLMAATLREANWPPERMQASRYNKTYKRPVRLTRAERSVAIRRAVLSASLVAEPARFIHSGRPEWIALEQVPEVLPLWRVYAEELRERGYSAWCGKLNAADYGVPQTRERAILVASRVRAMRRPEPTHYDSRKGMQLWGTPWVSMVAALGWGATGRPSPAVTAGGTRTGGAEPFPTRAREILAAERNAGRWVVDPNSSGHMRGYVRSVDRPSPALTGQVQFWRLRNNTQANAATRGLDEPAGTIFFGHRGNDVSWVNGEESERISVQDAGIIQSFPADYPWAGTKTKQYEQVGNAVPPLLAAHVVSMATGISLAEVTAA